MMEELIKESGFYEWVVERETPRIELQTQMLDRQELLSSAAQQRFGSLSAAGQVAIAATTDLVRLKAAILQVGSMPDEAALIAFLQAPIPDAAQ